MLRLRYPRWPVLVITALLLAAITVPAQAQLPAGGEDSDRGGRVTEFFAEGRQLELNGDLPAAYEAYRQAYELDPSHYRAVYRAGRLLRQMGKRENAHAALRRAIAIAPEFYPAYNHLGLLLVEEDDLDGAIEAYQAGAKVAPDLASAWRNLARALTEDGRLEAAVRAYQRALALEPEHHPSEVALAVLHARLGDRDVARKHVEAVLAADPDHARATEALVWLEQQRSGEPVGTLPAFADPARAAKKHVPTLESMIEETDSPFSAAMPQGGSFSPSGLYKPPPLGVESPVKVRQQGIIRIHNGEYQEGIALLQRALRYGDGDPVLFSELGYAHFELGEYEAAAEAYGRAAEAANPPQPWHRLNQGIALRAAGDLPGAANALERAVDREPAFAHAQYLLGLVHLEQKRLTAATRRFRAAVQADPANLAAHLSLAATLTARGELYEAVRAYRIALRVVPGDPEALVRLAGLLERLNRHGEALTAYEALELTTNGDPDYVDWHALAAEKVEELAWAAGQRSSPATAESRGLPFFDQ